MQAENIQMSQVKVCVRIRPFLHRQLINNDSQSITQLQENQIVIGNQSFRFDRVFDQNSTQEDIYNSQVKSLVDSYFKGYNATLLAYGQTGSGKTYTMGTSGIQSSGVIQLVVDQIFQNIEAHKHLVRYNIKVCFIEVYNEEVYDLLDENMQRNAYCGLPIRENRDKSITVVGAKEEISQNKADVLKLLSQGNCKRCTASNGINNVSSRSHAIFTIFMTQLPLKEDISQEQEIRSKFHFVDLAGSERLKKTKAEGATMNQGININKGLLHLGEVIKALSGPKSSKVFVPYRNSKLTRIIQDSLGGNSNTQVIACISPASSSFQETLNTLKYAQKAMNILNKPVINKDPDHNQIVFLKRRLRELQEQNAQLMSEEYCGRRKPLNIEDSYQYKTLASTWSNKVELLESQLKGQQIKSRGLELQCLNANTERDQALMFLKTNFNSSAVPSNLNRDILQELNTKIRDLQSQLDGKQGRIQELENELTHFLVCSKRDDEILSDKLRQIEQLKKEISSINREFDNDENEDRNSVLADVVMDSDNDDEQLVRKRDEFNARSDNISYQIGEVEEVISNRVRMLQDINSSQVLLENQLIELIKEQYGAKIRQFEIEKEKLQNDLIHAVRNQSNNTVAALKMKKDTLEEKLKECTKKLKEQEKLQKTVQEKERKVSTLKEQIGRSKLEKIQLNRKLKEESQEFQKFKQKKGKEIIGLNRIKMKRDIEIKRLLNRNNRKDMEILKVKQINAKLKKDKDNLLRTLKVGRKTVACEDQRPQNEESRIAEKIISSISENIVKSQNHDKVKQELLEIQKQLSALHEIDNEKTIKRIRMEYDGKIAEMEEISQELELCREQIDVLEKKEAHLRMIEETHVRSEKFSFESEILENPRFHNVNVLRVLFQEVVYKLELILEERNTQEHKIHQLIIENNLLKQQVQEMNQNLFYQQQSHKENLQSLRKELSVRNHQYQTLMNKAMTNKDETKKELQKAQKHVRELSRETEQQRRRNEILTDKYDGARKLNYKDKFIGIHRSSQSLPKISTFRERRIERNNETDRGVKFSSIQRKIMQFDTSSVVSNSDRNSDVDDFQEQSGFLKQGQNWECFEEMFAHDSPINHLELSQNTLLSTATKSLKIWDTSRLVLDHQLTKFQGFVKSATISQEYNLVMAACQGTISLWDKRTYELVRMIKRQDVVKTFKVQDNLLYSGGNGGLEVWDLRKGDLLDEREKKEDILAMVFNGQNLYFGSRNHHVKQMNKHWEISTLNPPHYDMVTSLATFGDYLISGSKDKFIKLWSINREYVVDRSSIQAHNSYVNALCADGDLQLIFSGSKQGQAKIFGFDKERDRLQILGSIQCHSESINTMICKGKTLMTGSSDKTIKIWRQEK